MDEFFITFSEPAFAVDPDSVLLLNGTIQNFTWMTPTLVQFNVVPDLPQCDVLVDIRTLRYTDGAGNTGMSSSMPLHIHYDVIPPLASVSSEIPHFANTSTAALAGNKLRITLSEMTTSLTHSSISTSTGVAVTSFSSIPPEPGARSVFEVTLTFLSNGPVLVHVPARSFTDLAGTWNALSASYAFVYDSMAPTCSLSFAVPYFSNVSTFNVTAVLSETPWNISAVMLQTGVGTSVSVLSIITSPLEPSSWPGQASVTVVFAVSPAQQGHSTLVIAAGTFSDFSGNGNVASNSLAFVFDTIAPMATLTSTARLDKANNVFPSVTLTLSEMVTDVSISAITCVNCAVLSVAAAVTTPNTFTLETAPLISSGPIRIFLQSGALQDLAGNGLLPSNVVAFDWDVVPPFCWFTSATPARADQHTLRVVHMSCRKALNSSLLTISSFSVQSVEITALQVVNSSSFVLTVLPILNASSPLAAVKVSISIQAGHVVDTVGNPSVVDSGVASDSGPVVFSFFYAHKPDPVQPSPKSYTVFIAVGASVFGFLSCYICLYYKRFRKRPAQSRSVTDALSSKSKLELEEEVDLSQRSPRRGFGSAAAGYDPKSEVKVDQSQPTAAWDVEAGAESAGHPTEQPGSRNCSPSGTSDTRHSPNSLPNGDDSPTEAAEVVDEKPIPGRSRQVSIPGQPDGTIPSDETELQVQRSRSRSTGTHQGSPSAYTLSPARLLARERSGSRLSPLHLPGGHGRSTPLTRCASGISIGLSESPASVDSGQTDIVRNPFADIQRKNSVASITLPELTDTAPSSQRNVVTLPTIANRQRLLSNPRTLRDQVARSPIRRERSSSIQTNQEKPLDSRRRF